MCAPAWCDFDLTFDLSVVTLSLKMLSVYIPETVGVECSYLVGACEMLWCNFGVMF